MKETVQEPEAAGDGRRDDGPGGGDVHGCHNLTVIGRLGSRFRRM